MATVVSKTSSKVDQLLADVIVDAHVQDGYLLVTTRGGAQINAGPVGGGDGTTWISGPGVPTLQQGLLGDYYLDTSTGIYYEKTTASVWTQRGSLKGPKGDTGNTGPVGPVGPTGGDASIYVDPSPPIANEADGHLWYDTDDVTLDPFSWNDLSDKPKLSYLHTQAVASASWNIPHAMGYFPNVTVVDSSGNEVLGDVQHVDAFNVIITFGAAFGGQAYLS